MTRLFITATGTELGKTYVTAALAHAARQAGRSVRALKPVLSGFDGAELAASDAGILLEAQGLGPDSLDRITPWRFAAPLSPDMAAAREGRAIDFPGLIEFCQAALAGPEAVVLIEGVGGVMVPLGPAQTVLDWLRALDLPVLLVAGSYLGTISHTLTALAVLARAQVAVRAVVLSQSPDQPVPLAETAATIARFSAVPVIALPRRADWRDVPELVGLLEIERS